MVKKVNMNKIERICQFALPAICLAACIAFVFCPASANAVYSAVTMIEKILKILCSVVGAVFLLVGIVKFAIAHANEDGPAQQKAIMMIATGVILLVLVTLIGGVINITTMINY